MDAKKPPETPPSESSTQRALVIGAAVGSTLLTILIAYLVLGSLWRPDWLTLDRSPRQFTILQINDVYKIEGLEGGTLGGLARIRSLRRELEREGPVLVLHGGDLLFPSVMSKYFKAEAMIEVMNLLDGRTDAFDPNLIVTFGNHEFDQDTPDVLAARLRESDFRWVSSNVYYQPPGSAQPEPFAKSFDTVHNTLLVNIAGLRVGIFGLTLDDAPQTYVHYDYAYAATRPNVRNATIRASLAHLQEAGADIIVALTHQELSEDMRLACDFPEIDLIVGGHDHIHQMQRVGRTLITKADSDAKTAMVIDVDATQPARLRTAYRLVTLDTSYVQDRAVQAVIDRWVDSLGTTVPGYDSVYATTRHKLEGEEPAVRGRETALGNWLVDIVRDTLKTDVAFIHGGSIRINDNIPAGGTIRGEHLAGIFYFDGDLVSFELTGQQLLDILNVSISQADAGAGRFLQVSGIEFAYHSQATAQPSPCIPATASYRVDSTTVKIGGVLLQPDSTYTVATLKYLWQNGYRDGYEVFAEGDGKTSPPLKEQAPITWRGATDAWLKKNAEVTTQITGRIRRQE